MQKKSSLIVVGAGLGLVPAHQRASAKVASAKKRQQIWIQCITFLLFFSCIVNLSQGETHDLYAFNESAKQVEFETLLKDLRCLVCQGQDLHDSQTPFAETLKQQIHQWVLEGKSEKEILAILTYRYGDSISFAPPLQRNTYILWIAPFALFFIIIFSLLITITKRKKNIS